MGEGLLNHFHLIRLRVKGSGILRPKFYSLDEIYSQTLATLDMAAATNREPTILSNVTEQRAKLELKTTDIDETFRISKIVIYVKPVASGFSG